MGTKLKVELEAENKEFQKQIEEYKKQVEALQIDVSGYTSKIESLEKSLAEAKREIEKLTAIKGDAEHAEGFIKCIVAMAVEELKKVAVEVKQNPKLHRKILGLIYGRFQS